MPQEAKANCQVVIAVNKTDSPRISAISTFDRKQPLGVSLKGSSLVSFGTEEAASGSGPKAIRETGSDKFRGAPGFPFEVNPGVPEKRRSGGVLSGL